MSVGRREFLGAGATVAGLTLARPGQAADAMLRALDPGRPVHAAAARPVVIASANGLRGVARAYDLIAREHADPLDAAIAGVNIHELDPDDQSAGLGGLPNEAGVVLLGASCMHGPTGRAGAVAALDGIATPSLVARAAMECAEHGVLVGDGAKRFALRMGFTEQNLLTERSRQTWLRWMARQNPNGRWLDHDDDCDDDVRTAFPSGTVTMHAVTAAGDIASVTTTSGQSWTVPGRVGDPPPIGAGQYCDNAVGAAGSTRRSEAMVAATRELGGAFLAVEFMRLGMSPEAALLRAMERVIAMAGTRLLTDRGRPCFDLELHAVARDGRFAGASAYAGSRFAVCDAGGARLVDSAYLFGADERPSGGPEAGPLRRR